MISSALNIGASGLRTMQAVIDNHSRNIANADTPGYRRRDTLLAEQVNGGVTYSTAHRFNETTAARLTQLAGEVGASDALARELTGAQAQLGTASTQLADAQHSLATALANAVFAPNDATTRTMVAENAAGLAQIADTNLRELDARITGANQAERLTRAQAQTKLDELAMLNQQVLANGATPAIRDRQAQVGQELASLAGGEMRFNPNGSAEFRIDGMLVLTSAGAKQLPQTLGGQAGGFAQARAELTGLRDGFETNLREYARAMNTLNQQGVDAGGQPGEELFSMEGGRFSFVGSAASLALAGNSGAGSVAQQMSELDTLTTGTTVLATTAAERTRAARGVADAQGFALAGWEQFRQEEEGVDVDAEMIALKNAQRAYEANAKVIQIADAMLGTLLAIKN